MVESPICQTSHDSGESESPTEKVLNREKGDKEKMEGGEGLPLNKAAKQNTKRH